MILMAGGTIHCDTSVGDTVTEVQGGNKPCANHLTKFQTIWMEIGILLRFVSLMDFILIASCPIGIEERDSC